MTWAFSPAISAIIVALLISLFSPLIIHYFLYRHTNSKEPPTFLLVGPSGAGKTSLLTLLANGTPSPTHTSQSPTTALCQLPSSARAREDQYRSEHDTTSLSRPKFLLSDTPGHGKLRHHATAFIKRPTALKGVIFVVDSAALSSNAGLTETAEYLHDILLLLQMRHTQAKTSKGTEIPVLVAANKQDVFTSLPASLVRSRLEGEIEKVRQTRSKGLLDSGVSTEDDIVSGVEESNWLGEFGSKEFSFTQMGEHGVDIKVLGGNVVGHDDAAGEVGDWWDWIGDNL